MQTNRNLTTEETLTVITETITETEQDIRKYAKYLEKGARIALLVIQMLQQDKITITPEATTTRGLHDAMLARSITDKIAGQILPAPEIRTPEKPKISNGTL